MVVLILGLYEKNLRVKACLFALLVDYKASNRSKVYLLCKAEIDLFEYCATVHSSHTAFPENHMGRVPDGKGLSKS